MKLFNITQTKQSKDVIYFLKIFIILWLLTNGSFFVNTRMFQIFFNIHLSFLSVKTILFINAGICTLFMLEIKGREDMFFLNKGEKYFSFQESIDSFSKITIVKKVVYIFITLVIFFILETFAASLSIFSISLIGITAAKILFILLEFLSICYLLAIFKTNKFLILNERVKDE